MSIDAFFRWMETQEHRYELVNGVPRLQPWVKRSHSLIVGNIDFALRSCLDRNAYALHQGDFAISTGPNGIRYADLLVEPSGAPMDARTADQAILVIEVLSESTMHLDFGAKRLEYMGLASMHTYLVVAQDRKHVWQWSRDEYGDFAEEPVHVTAGDVAIEYLAVTLSLDDIYRGVL